MEDINLEYVNLKVEVTQTGQSGLVTNVTSPCIISQ